MLHIEIVSDVCVWVLWMDVWIMFRILFNGKTWFRWIRACVNLPLLFSHPVFFLFKKVFDGKLGACSCYLLLDINMQKTWNFKVFKYKDWSTTNAQMLKTHFAVYQCFGAGLWMNKESKRVIEYTTVTYTTTKCFLWMVRIPDDQHNLEFYSTGKVCVNEYWGHW